MSSAERARSLIWLACLLLIAVLGARWLVGQGGGSAAGAGWAGRSTGVATTVSPRQALPVARPDIMVHVAGAVKHAGVYRLHSGARVYEAMQAAGGATRRGDQNALDLAARLGDGQKVMVPVVGQAAAGSSAGSAAASGAPTSTAQESGPVSLATATAEQLDALDGIGPALAKRIVDWRAQHGGFASIDDLDKVPGIGPAKLSALRGAIAP